MFPGTTTKISESIVASASSISPLSDLVLITGSTAIATIVPPPNFGTGVSAGVMILIPTDGTLATLTTGNIALALTMAQNQTCLFVYSAKKAKWYPGAIS